MVIGPNSPTVPFLASLLSCPLHPGAWLPLPFFSSQSHPWPACLPGLPGFPSLPGLPGLSCLPGIPGPSVSGLGGLPGLPGVPLFPSLPGLSGLPDIPGLPGLSGLPLFPGLSGLPGLPVLPGLLVSLVYCEPYISLNIGIECLQQICMYPLRVCSRPHDFCWACTCGTCLKHTLNLAKFLLFGQVQSVF